MKQVEREAMEKLTIAREEHQQKIEMTLQEFERRNTIRQQSEVEQKEIK